MCVCVRANTYPKSTSSKIRMPSVNTTDGKRGREGEREGEGRSERRKEGGEEREGKERKKEKWRGRVRNVE